MIDLSKSTTPEIHEAAARLARRFVDLVGAALADVERSIAVQSAYAVAREELERFEGKTSS